MASPLIVSSPFVPFVSGAVFAVVATSSSRTTRRIAGSSQLASCHVPLNGSLSGVGIGLPSSRSTVPLSPITTSSSPLATPPRPSPPWSTSLAASSPVALSIRPSTAVASSFENVRPVPPITSS